MQAIDSIPALVTERETHADSPPSASLVARVMRNRLAQFALIGAGLFLAAPKATSADVIRVTSEERAALHAAAARRLGVPALSPEDAAKADTRALEDEILYREAVRLGLDKSDGVVRQRLVQRSLFLAEDMAGAASQPSDADLNKFYSETKSSWTRGGREHFIHVYLSQAADESRIRAVETALASLGAHEGAPALGDAFPLSRDTTLGDEQIAAQYGDGFARDVLALAPGAWSGPILSKYGTHFVKVVAREDGRPATFDEALPQLRLAFVVARKKHAVEDFVDRACARYTLEFDGAPPVCGATGRAPAGRRDGWD